jgi:hypothetical protein
MSLVTKLKSVPIHYWILGLGGGALAVDYFVEGQRSVVSSVWRGIFGSREHPAVARARKAAFRRGGIHPSAQPMMQPQMPSAFTVPQGAMPQYYPAMPPPVGHGPFHYGQAFHWPHGEPHHGELHHGEHHHHHGYGWE